MRITKKSHVSKVLTLSLGSKPYPALFITKCDRADSLDNRSSPVNGHIFLRPFGNLVGARTIALKRLSRKFLVRFYCYQIRIDNNKKCKADLFIFNQTRDRFFCVPIHCFFFLLICGRRSNPHVPHRDNDLPCFQWRQLLACIPLS